jgi:hypothetical protein
MPYTIQVQDVQNNVAIKKICGVRTDSPEFLALVNEVENSLMIRGGWFDLEQRIQFCLSSHYLVWPEFVGTVLAIRFCHGDVAVSRNGWYSFAPRAAHGRRGYGWGDGFNGGGYGHRGHESDVVVENANSRPCYNDISGGNGKQVRYSVPNADDIGKTITLYGKQYGGQPLQERVNGSVVNGLTIAAANPFSSTTALVTEIQSIVREPTSGMGYLYEYDPVCGTLRDIAAFRPGETHPRYRCSRILNNRERAKDANGCCWTQVEALIKLKFIELTNERDFIPVDNLRALKLGIQAVLLEEANEDEAAAEKWALAVHELNLESFDKSPDDQIVFENNTFGDTRVGRRRLW